MKTKSTTNMIEQAENIIKEYEELQKDMRGGSSYNHENWHAVNVKRYNDYIDINNIVKNPLDYKKYFNVIKDNYEKHSKLIKKYKEKIQNHFNEEQLDYMYGDFLDREREQLNYELSDIKEITEGSKDEHKSFKHIKILNQNVNPVTESLYIYFLGRSGGWACFQDDIEGIVEDLQNTIEYYEDDKGAYEAEMLENIGLIKEGIEEVKYIKDYIEKFNNSINPLYETLYRINEYIEELEIETKNLEESKENLLSDIEKDTNNIIERLDQHKKNKTLVKNLKKASESVLLIINNSK